MVTTSAAACCATASTRDESEAPREEEAPVPVGVAEALGRAAEFEATTPARLPDEEDKEEEEEEEAGATPPPPVLVAGALLLLLLLLLLVEPSRAAPLPTRVRGAGGGESMVPAFPSACICRCERRLKKSMELSESGYPSLAGVAGIALPDPSVVAAPALAAAAPAAVAAAAAVGGTVGRWWRGGGVRGLFSARCCRERLPSVLALWTEENLSASSSMVGPGRRGVPGVRGVRGGRPAPLLPLDPAPPRGEGEGSEGTLTVEPARRGRREGWGLGDWGPE